MPGDESKWREEFEAYNPHLDYTRNEPFGTYKDPKINLRYHQWKAARQKAQGEVDEARRYATKLQGDLRSALSGCDVLKEENAKLRDGAKEDRATIVALTSSVNEIGTKLASMPNFTHPELLKEYGTWYGSAVAYGEYLKARPQAEKWKESFAWAAFLEAENIAQ